MTYRVFNVQNVPNVKIDINIMSHIIISDVNQF